jgi:hypothetical protein
VRMARLHPRDATPFRGPAQLAQCALAEHPLWHGQPRSVGSGQPMRCRPRRASSRYARARTSKPLIPCPHGSKGQSLPTLSGFPAPPLLPAGNRGRNCRHCMRLPRAPKRSGSLEYIPVELMDAAKTRVFSAHRPRNVPVLSRMVRARCHRQARRCAAAQGWPAPQRPTVRL